MYLINSTYSFKYLAHKPLSEHFIEEKMLKICLLSKSKWSDSIKNYFYCPTGKKEGEQGWKRVKTTLSGFEMTQMFYWLIA